MELKEVRYIFEHELLPMKYFDGKDEFLADLLIDEDNSAFRYMKAVCEEEGVECTYSEGQFKVMAHKLNDTDYMVKIILPEPEDKLLCSKIYMLFDEECRDMRYFTVERDMVKGKKKRYMLCEWNSEHEHINYGYAPNDIKQLENIIIGLYYNS